MRVLDTSAIKVFVLDEADEMLMLGGLGDMTKRIRSKLPKKVQTLFFSATWTVRVAAAPPPPGSARAAAPSVRPPTGLLRATSGPF